MSRTAGSPNKPKRFRAAFERFYDAHPDKLDALAAKLDAQAARGDTTAFTIIRDTMDGKPAQAIVGDDESGPVKLEIAWAKPEGDA